MPALDYLIPCQLTSIDQRTNAVSLFNVIESLDVVRRPGETDAEAWSRVLAPMEVVTLWRRLPGEAPNQPLTQILTFVTPDGTESEVSRADFAIPHFRHRLHVQLPALAVSQEGDLILRVYLSDPQTTVVNSLEQEYPIKVSKTDLPIIVELEPAELAWLKRPVAGQGGFQSLLRRIQQQIVGDRLVLSEEDGERLVRYARQYGGGGFQARLGRIVQQVQDQLQRLVPVV